MITSAVLLHFFASLFFLWLPLSPLKYVTASYFSQVHARPHHADETAVEEADSLNRKHFPSGKQGPPKTHPTRPFVMPYYVLYYTIQIFSETSWHTLSTDKLSYLRLFCHFKKEKNGSTFSTNSFGQAGGGWPRPPLSVNFWLLIPSHHPERPTKPTPDLTISSLYGILHYANHIFSKSTHPPLSTDPMTTLCY